MYNKNIALKHFSEILSYQTVKGNEEEFTKLHNALKVMYPNIYKSCDFELIGDKGLMYRLKGKSSNQSIVLMSHYDVVPANKGEWLYPPFSGKIAKGRIWGRGTLDTKGTFCAIMETVETLIKEGFIPKSDIYMCFGGDEETDGYSAIQIAEELKTRGVKPYLVLDEGGAVVDGKIAGINHPCALVGIAEKGYMDVEFITSGGGGHSSLPLSSNPITIMSEVIRRINDNVFKPHMSEPVRIMINSVAKHTNPLYSIVLRNYWLWGILFRKHLVNILPEIDSLTKTIGTITQIDGGSAENIIPEHVRAVGNFRIINGSSVRETLCIIKKALKGLNVEVNLISGLDPSLNSKIGGKGWKALSSAIGKSWDNNVIIPYLMLARSDSRSYSIISDNIYRFSPIMLSKNERGSIHGVNENISIEGFCNIIEFYMNLVLGS